MLASEQGRRKARGEKLPNPTRITKVCFVSAWSAQATEQHSAQAVNCAFVLSTAVSKADVSFLWRSQAWVSAVLQVKKSMARIKLVLTERAIAITDPVQSQAMRAMINS